MREDILLLRRRRMRRAALFVGQSLTFISSNATITPAITLSGDGPCQWEVTEADGHKHYYSTNSFSHTRSVAGNMTVRLLNTMQVAPYVTTINFASDGIVSAFSSLHTNLFSNIIGIFLNTNQLTGDWTAEVLPSALTNLYLGGNLFTGDWTTKLLPNSLQFLNIPSIGFTGDWTGKVLPTGLVDLNILGNAFYGNLSTTTLPSSTLNVYLSSNLFTGLPTVPNPTPLRVFQAASQGAANMTQPRIDAFVTDMYSKRAYFTYATPTFNIGGTNADPSGVYQNPFPNPPATPLEMIWCLVNDPFVEGFNKQVWTY